MEYLSSITAMSEETGRTVGLVVLVLSLAGLALVLRAWLASRRRR